MVSLLKSMVDSFMLVHWSLPRASWRLRRAVEDEVAAVLAVHLVDRLAHLALHPVEPAAHARELVLEVEHALDAGEVEADLGRQPLDQLQPLTSSSE